MSDRIYRIAWALIFAAQMFLLGFSFGSKRAASWRAVAEKEAETTKEALGLLKQWMTVAHEAQTNYESCLVGWQRAVVAGERLGRMLEERSR